MLRAKATHKQEGRCLIHTRVHTRVHTCTQTYICEMNN